MHNLKILHIHWAFHPITGGVESHLLTLCKGISLANHNVTIVHGTRDGCFPAGYPGTVNLIYSPLLDLTSDETTDPELEPYLKWADVVHCHNVHYFDIDKAISLCRYLENTARGKPIFHTIHETWKQGMHENILDSNIWAKQFVISEYIRSSITHRQSTLKLHTLRYGVDDDFLNREESISSCSIQLTKNEGMPLIVHPARLLPWKGTDWLLESVEVLLEMGFKFRLIITDTTRIVDYLKEVPSFRYQIFRKIDSSASLKRFVSVRSFPRKEMPSLLQHADIVVYPTTGDEPFGIVPAEAIFSGAVPVVSRSGGLTETVSANVNGLVVEKWDVEGLVEAIGSLLRNRTLYERLRNGGKDLINKFSEQVMVHNHINEYMSYIQGD
jgi:glycosyltransferase involved in cell wall biosynthesis